jgi:hypothetical protein
LRWLPVVGSVLFATTASAQGLLYELTSPNEEAFGHFGYAVSGVEDVDADGRNDFLIGASEETSNASDEGRVYVFSGGTGALLHTLVSPNVEAEGAFGIAIAGVPDVDSDGRGDLLVGANGESLSPDHDEAGRAYLFSGATGALLHTLRSPVALRGGYFGASVAGVDDVDGDGKSDLLVGMPSRFVFADAGRAFVFSGATGALLQVLVSPNSEPFGSFGIAVAGLLDVDWDGRGDLLVGADHEDPGSSPERAGRAYVFSGATGVLLHTLVSPNEEFLGGFGEAVAGVLDVDGDGAGDLLVGAKAEAPGMSPDAAGRAYVFNGASGALLAELISLNEEMNGLFGSAVSGVPDTDSDGRGDLLVGAYQESPGPSPEAAGRAYLFSGRLAIPAVEPGAGGGPRTHDLSPIRPNPSSGRAELTLEVAEAQVVRVEVLDALGRRVAVLHDGPLSAGVAHAFVLDGPSLPAGVYAVRVVGETFADVRTLTRVR